MSPILLISLIITSVSFLLAIVCLIYIIIDSILVNLSFKKCLSDLEALPITFHVYSEEVDPECTQGLDTIFIDQI